MNRSRRSQAGLESGRSRSSRHARFTRLIRVASLSIGFAPTVTAQRIMPPPWEIVKPTVAVAAPLLPGGPYRLTLTVPPSAGAPAITRHVRGTLVHTGSTITVHLEHSLTMHGTLTGDRLDLRTADTHGDTLALALTATANHAVGTVVIASTSRRTTGTATLEPEAPAGAHGSGAATARNRDVDGTCGNTLTCLIRDLFGLFITPDP